MGTDTILSFLIITICFAFSNAAHTDHPSSLCTQTPYPQLCESLFVVHKLQNSSTVRNLALGATLARAQSAHDHISAMGTTPFPFNQLANLAWADCVNLYEDTLYKVRRAAAATTTTNDAQTWLSAAITNHQTCQNGFTDFQLPFNFHPFHDIATDLLKHLSNSLAIINALALSPPPPSLPPTVNGRGSLAVGFPIWLSRSERRLLRPNVAKSSADIVVAQDGSGNYETVSEALAAAAALSSGGGRFVIYVKKGVYEENVVVTDSMNNFMLVGDGIDATIITGNRSIGDGYTTFHSATLAVIGDGFMAREITFENTAGPENHQAVALRSGSDFSVFYRCSFKGYQDTLYVYSQRQFYAHCDIYGTVDFIFGDAIAVLQNCTIYVRKPMTSQKNFVTAQGRSDPNQNTGIVIHNSHVTATEDLRAVESSFPTYLGRPWEKYSRTVFLTCTLDSLIDPDGWFPWIENVAQTLYYGEYMNTGDGAQISGRVKWPGYHVITSAIVAQKLSVGDFLACVTD
ncbi:PREDICTED: pectinesterase-like [Ipomoea nil]|uniref:pectinesterase-like n=1 Tax=Ipomoea nil TaxID=35883 RepID=UPI000900B178|nr:PREDICTED: pectinesterase-like [Ipomoea nil]